MTKHVLEITVRESDNQIAAKARFDNTINVHPITVDEVGIGRLRRQHDEEDYLERIGVYGDGDAVFHTSDGAVYIGTVDDASYHGNEFLVTLT